MHKTARSSVPPSLPLVLNCCGHFSDMPDHATVRARPRDWLLIWSLGGRGYCQTEGRSLDVQPGDLVLLLPRVAQRYGAERDDPWDILWLHASGPAAGPMWRGLRRFGDDGPCVRLGRDEVIRERFVELVVHSGRPTWPAAGEPVWPDTEAHAILGLMWRRLDQLTRVPRRPSPFDPVAVARHIHDHLPDRLTLDSLAAVAGLSPAHFARLFRRHFGVSPIRYLNQKRIDVACAMLDESDMKLWQIAHRVGFDDPYYFSRLFRLHTGVPPSAYRGRRVSG